MLNKFFNRFQAKPRSLDDWTQWAQAFQTRGSKDEYEAVYNDVRDDAYPLVDQVEDRYGFAIDRDWLNQLALQTQVGIKASRINYQHGRLLYTLLRQRLSTLPKEEFVTVVETGTARGFSAICMAKALKDAKFAGHILSIDVCPHNTKQYWNCIADHGGRQTRAELLSDWSDLAAHVVFLQADTGDALGKQRLGLNRIHFAFLDAHHDYYQVMTEFSYVASRQMEGDIVFFDDVTEALFPGVVSAIRYIKDNFDYKLDELHASNERGYAWAERV